MNDSPEPWSRKPGGHRLIWWIVLIAVVLLTAVLALNWRFPYVLDDTGNWALLAYMLCLLVVLCLVWVSQPVL